MIKFYSNTVCYSRNSDYHTLDNLGQIMNTIYSMLTLLTAELNISHKGCDNMLQCGKTEELPSPN
jgi:hypothetical protein